MVSTPKPPDPMETAAAHSGMNRDTAITQQRLNMVNQYNPWGSVEYEQTGTSGFTDSQGNWVETPVFQQTTTLSPEQQEIFTASQQAQGNLANLASEQSERMRQYLAEPFEFTNRDAETWAYDLASPRILAQQGQNEAQLRATLAAKGIGEGSAAWNAEMARMTNANTDQLNQLALTGRGQAFNEALSMRNQPINEISALLSGSQIQNPGQSSPQAPQTGVAGVNYSGLVQDNYKQQLDASQARMGGLFGLISGGIGLLSDERAKEDIRRVGETDDGQPIYTYKYRGGGPHHMGVMAQETDPDAVMEMGGLMAVDYSKVT